MLGPPYLTYGKQLIQFNIEIKTKQPNQKNEQKNWIDIFSKEGMKMATTHEMLNITNHQEMQIKNHKEISPYTYQNGYHKNKQTNKQQKQQKTHQ